MTNMERLECVHKSIDNISFELGKLAGEGVIGIIDSLGIIAKLTNKQDKWMKTKFTQEEYDAFMKSV